MPVQCKQISSNIHPFEREIFDYMCRVLQSAGGEYTVTGPLRILGREIDGLIIKSDCIFTIEAKAIEGRVVKKDFSAEIQITDKSGHQVDLSGRNERMYDQAIRQWQHIRDFLKKTFDTERFFVKSILVFPNGSTFDVPSYNRDFSEHRVEAFIATVDEIPQVLQQFSAPFPTNYDRLAQDAIITALQYGPNRLTDADREAVKRAAQQKRPKPEQRLEKQQIQQGSGQSEAVHKQPYEPERKQGSLLGFLGRLIGVGLLVALAFFSLKMWLSPLISGGLSLLLFLLLWYGRWGRALYTYLGGLMLGFMSKVMGMGLLVSILAAALWPLALLLGGYLIVTSDDMYSFLTDYIPFMEEVSLTPVPAVTVTAVPINVSPTPGNSANENQLDTAEEAPAAVDPTPTQAAAKQALVQNNSNVRAGPSLEEAVVGVALGGQVFAVLEESADGNWYKIELETGKVGWIGSSRVEEIVP